MDRLSLNLHDYDKKADGIIKRIRELPKPEVSLDYMRQIADELGSVGNVWKILVDDHEIDPINSVRVDELMPYITDLWNRGDAMFKATLIDQLTDMQSGFCQQGRTLRLIQLINAYWVV
jgi:hypothetical protein